jgi:hypothetical protein
MAFNSIQPADAGNLEIHGIVRENLDSAANSSDDGCAAEKSELAVHETPSAAQVDLTLDEQATPSDDERSFATDIAGYNSTRPSQAGDSGTTLRPEGFSPVDDMEDDDALPDARPALSRKLDVLLAMNTAATPDSASSMGLSPTLPVSRAEWINLGKPRCACGITHPPPCDPDRVATGRVNKSLGHAPKAQKKRKSKPDFNRRCFRCRGFHNQGKCISTQCKQCEVIHKKGEPCPVDAELVERSVATSLFNILDVNDAAVVSKVRRSLEMHCRKNNLPLSFIDQIPHL